MLLDVIFLIIFFWYLDGYIQEWVDNKPHFLNNFIPYASDVLAVLVVLNIIYIAFKYIT